MIGICINVDKENIEHCLIVRLKEELKVHKMHKILHGKIDFLFWLV